jgi:carbon starvation protein CstA
MKKAYYLLFYKLYRFWEAVGDDNWSDWKALVIIGGCQALLLIELLVWWTVITKVGADFSKYLLIVPGLFIAVMNYYVFLHNDHWKVYEAEFKSYSSRKNRIINLSVLMFILLVIGSLIFAFYKMSLIDWSKFR